MNYLDCGPVVASSPVIHITCEGGRIGPIFWINSDPATIRDCCGLRCILWGAVRWGRVMIWLEVQP
jgi:hypothetical protein